jgi:hypothetical protein
MKNITKSIIALFAVVALSCSVEDVQIDHYTKCRFTCFNCSNIGAAYVLTPANAATSGAFLRKSANHGGDVRLHIPLKWMLKETL